MSFSDAQKKVQEHYNIEVPITSIGIIVENHAKNIFEFVEAENPKEGTQKQIIAETDGCMVPIVTTRQPEEGHDSRKARSLRWIEARLCFARNTKELKPAYYAKVGNVNEIGDLLYKAALKVGFGSRTKVHGVGDGASWIINQMQRVFASQVNFLVDFYHVSEYLAEAAEHGWASCKAIWRREQQALLKENKFKQVLEKLKSQLSQSWWEKYQNRENENRKGHSRTSKDENSPQKKLEETPVEACYRYLDNRQEYLNYKSALEQGLPIGSGEVESGHKSITQKRMKIPGAWWHPRNVNPMLALRTLRANEDWERYWSFYNSKAA